MTIITTQTVRTSDLLNLASLPKPTMIPSLSKRSRIDPASLAVIAASIPRPKCIERRALPSIDQTPRPATSHVALEGASQ